MRPIDHNGHVPEEPSRDTRETVTNPFADLPVLAAKALYEVGRLHGVIESMQARIAELQAKVDASRERM